MRLAVGRDVARSIKTGIKVVRVTQRQPAEILQQVTIAEPETLRASRHGWLVQTLVTPVKQRNVTRTVPCRHAGHLDDDARDPILLDPGDDDGSDLAHAGMIGELDAHQPHVVHFRLTHDRRCHPPDRPTPEAARYCPCSSNARNDTRREPEEPDTRRIGPASDSA